MPLRLKNETTIQCMHVLHAERCICRFTARREQNDNKLLDSWSVFEFFLVVTAGGSPSALGMSLD